MGDGKTQPPPTAMVEVVAIDAGAVNMGTVNPAGVEIRAAGGISAEDTELEAGSPPTSAGSPPRERRGPEGRLMEVLAIKLWLRFHLEKKMKGILITLETKSKPVFFCH